MGRPKKLAPMEAFELNMADAQALLAFATALDNKRTRRMRKELRERIGDALRIPKRDLDTLDCIESDALFVVLRPDSVLTRDDFTDLRPLLRQAIVAGSAAFETFVADEAITRLGDQLRKDELPKRLGEISLSVADWRRIESEYKRKQWGIRPIAETHIVDLSSVAPSKVGEVLSTVGISEWAKKVDNERKVAKGTTVKQLSAISDRRNAIAHSADRSGQGRSALEPALVEQYLQELTEVAQAIDVVSQKA